MVGAFMPGQVMSLRKLATGRLRESIAESRFSI